MSGAASRTRDLLLPLLAKMARRVNTTPDDTILILQPDHLGDIILSQPAVAHLRAAFPSSRLVGVVGPWSATIAGMAWPVDDIVEIEYPGFTRTQQGRLVDPYLYLRATAHRLASRNARAAVILRPDAWWAAWLGALVAPHVVTSDDSRASHFATTVVPVSPHAHATLRAAQIASGLTNGTVQFESNERHLSIPENPDAGRALRELRQRHAITGEYVVIHPGSGAPVKEWPPHRWSSVARRVAALGYGVVLTGSEVERPLCEAIASDLDGIAVLAGETTVETLAELLRGARLVLGPDCGPLHLAVAVGAPTIHLFGPSDPRRYGPWGSATHNVIVSAGWSCPRCGDLSPARQAGCGCMLAISTEHVMSAVGNQIDAHART